MKRIYIKTVFAAFLVLISCQKEKNVNDATAPPSQLLSNLSAIQIPASQVPFFADISKYNLSPKALKTRAGEQTVSLESLLNRGDEQERTFEGNTFRQIPFIQNDGALLASVGDEADTDIESASVLKKFYVIVSSNEEVQEYIVTMVTGRQFADFHPDFDYLHKANYTGVILYSSLGGQVLEVRSYKGGLSQKSILLTKEDIESGYYDSKWCVKLFSSKPDTRAAQNTEEWYLDCPECIFYGDLPHNNGNNIDDDPWPDDFIIPDAPDGGGGGGGWPGSNGSGSSGEGVLKPIKKIEYKVNLSTNLPEYVTMIGSGSYEEGSIIEISFSYNYQVLNLTFNMWTGDFHRESSPTFTHLVTRTVTSTAYFDCQSPCENKDANIINPLIEMSVAASGSINEDGDAWLNWIGGTFGMTRSSGKKRHTGIDLYAEPGTPVYAVYGGRITKAFSDAYSEYDDAHAFGNELQITTENDEGLFLTQYAHLLYGTPFAINPRTNKPFAKDDIVYPGDLIAYTGRTGNAFNPKDVPYSHLHFGIKIGVTSEGKGGAWTDPSGYLNGTINSHLPQQLYKKGAYDLKSLVKNGQLLNIRCDD